MVSNNSFFCLIAERFLPKRGFTQISQAASGRKKIQHSLPSPELQNRAAIAANVAKDIQSYSKEMSQNSTSLLLFGFITNASQN